MAIEQQPEASNVPPAHDAFLADAAAPPAQDSDPGHGQQLGPALREPRSDQLDIRRQLNTIRKHLVWVLLMSILSGVAAAFIGLSGTLPWRAERVLVVRRDSFSRASEQLYTYVSEDTLTSNVRKVLDDDVEAAKLRSKCKLTMRTAGMNKLTIVAEGPDKVTVKKLVDSIEPIFNKSFDKLMKDQIDGMQEKKRASEQKLVEVSQGLKKIGQSRRRAEVIRMEFERERLKHETLIAKKAALKGDVEQPGAEEKTGVPVRVMLSATDLKRKRLVEQIVTMEMKQSDFANRYTADHPQARSLNAGLERLRKELSSLAPPEPIVSASGGREINHLEILQASIVESAARKGVLEKYLKEAEKKVLVAGSDVQRQIGRDMLSRQMVLLNERISLLERLRSVKPLLAPDPTKTMPPRGFWERMLRSVPFGLMLGAVMGILFAMGMEHLRDSCSSPSEIHQDLGLSTLAIIPKLPEEGGICISPNDPHSDLAEMFSILRNNLRYSGANSPEKMVMVTSSLSGDGKSMIAMNLAVSFSFEGLSVLLVDADMRRSRGYAPLMGGAKSPGLVPWLEGQIDSPQEAVSTSLVPGLSVLSAGGKATNATKLVASPRMEYLLDWAQEHYDVVVIDTPAVLPVADTTMFASLARAVLMVVDSNTRTGAARAAISRLVHTRGKVVGAILNRADHRALGYMSYYGAKYGYGYGYGYRYGYKSYT